MMNKIIGFVSVYAALLVVYVSPFYFGLKPIVSWPIFAMIGGLLAIPAMMIYCAGWIIITCLRSPTSSVIEESEFGKGLAYSLGLFVAHQCMWDDTRNDKRLSSMYPQLWFNGASDHLYELQVGSAPKHLRPRLQALKDKGLHWGHGYKDPQPTEKDVLWAVEEAKALLLELDRHHRVPCKQAQWD